MAGKSSERRCAFPLSTPAVRCGAVMSSSELPVCCTMPAVPLSVSVSDSIIGASNELLPCGLDGEVEGCWRTRGAAVGVWCTEMCGSAFDVD